MHLCKLSEVFQSTRNCLETVGEIVWLVRLAGPGMHLHSNKLALIACELATNRRMSNASYFVQQLLEAPERRCDTISNPNLRLRLASWTESPSC